MCGKNPRVTACLMYSTGSPPRVREKRSILSTLTLLSGITPACAGKTTNYSTNALAPQDHPRVCGKNRLHALTRRYRTGSPPRVREKQQKDPAHRPVLLQKMDKFIHFCCKQRRQPCILKRPMWQLFNGTIRF